MDMMMRGSRLMRGMVFTGLFSLFYFLSCSEFAIIGKNPCEAECSRLNMDCGHNCEGYQRQVTGPEEAYERRSSGAAGNGCNDSVSECFDRCEKNYRGCLERCRADRSKIYKKLD